MRDRHPGQFRFSQRHVGGRGQESNDSPSASTKRVSGSDKVNFKLRDWVFSRQRYWGEPIPMVHCDHCGCVPLPEEDLPLLLPDVDALRAHRRRPESPLASMTDWVNANTAPTAARTCSARNRYHAPVGGFSSWYFLRYCDPHNDREFASKEALDYWMPVDWYNGGMEHTTLHLLYSRFWHKFLYDIGRGIRPGALSEAHQPRHDPGRKRRKNEQEPGQRD